MHDQNFLDVDRRIPKPNFVALGPGRCGTTWLHVVLGEHPDICESSVKETAYFDTEFHKGPGWYAQFFAHYAGERSVGEVATTYIASPEAAARLAAFNPAIRLMATVRDPVARAFSHYLRSKRNGQPLTTFEDAIKIRPVLLERSRYGAMLEPYLDRFPADQLKVLVYEDLRDDALGYCQAAYRFLGVDASFVPPSFDSRIQPASRAVHSGAARFVKTVAWQMRRAGLTRIIERAKRSFLTGVLYSAYAPGEHPELNPETRLQLIDRFHEDAVRLSKVVGRDLPALWWPDRR